MAFLETVGRFLLDLGIAWLNGFILLWYGVMAHLPHALAVAGAGVVLAFDRQVTSRGLSRPGRDGRGDIGPQGLRPRVSEALTVVVAIAWVTAALVYPRPVPWIGAAMWWAWILVLLCLPAERQALLWRGKGLLLTYALALLGFRLYLYLAGRFAPAAWAEVLGSSGEARRVIAGNLAIFSTIGTWLTWFVLPVAHFSYLIQRLLVNPLSLAAPFATAEEWIAAIRGRRGR